MPTISIRGNEMPASPIRKLAPLADAANLLSENWLLWQTLPSNAEFMYFT